MNSYKFITPGLLIQSVLFNNKIWEGLFTNKLWKFLSCSVPKACTQVSRLSLDKIALIFSVSINLQGSAVWGVNLYYEVSLLHLCSMKASLAFAQVRFSFGPDGVLGSNVHWITSFCIRT